MPEGHFYDGDQEQFVSCAVQHSDTNCLSCTSESCASCAAGFTLISSLPDFPAQDPPVVCIKNELTCEYDKAEEDLTCVQCDTASPQHCLDCIGNHGLPSSGRLDICIECEAGIEWVNRDTTRCTRCYGLDDEVNVKGDACRYCVEEAGAMDECTECKDPLAFILPQNPGMCVNC